MKPRTPLSVNRWAAIAAGIALSLVPARLAWAQQTAANFSDGASSPLYLIPTANKIFYAAALQEEGFGLYQYDTLAETGGRVSAPPFLELPSYVTRVEDQIFFVAEEIGGSEGRELWVSDGLTASQLVIRPGPEGAGMHEWPAALGSQLVFEAEGDTTTGHALWVSDGTESGTEMIKDLIGTSESVINDLTGIGSYVLFRGTDEANGSELWRTNGTTAGTELVADIQPGVLSSTPQQLTALDTLVVFTATDTPSGGELWKSDGQTVTQIADLEPGSGGSYPIGLIEVDGFIWFSAHLSSLGSELWRTNGFIADFVADINPGPEDSYPTDFVGLNGEVYFLAEDGLTGREVWKSDGSAAGTTLVHDFGSGPEEDGRASGLAAHDGFVYFGADADDGAGRELWRTDGSPTGTERVDDLNAGEAGSLPGTSTAESLNGHLYFPADDGTDTGRELYRTDSTLGNVELAWDPTPDRGSNPEQLHYWLDWSGVEQIVAFARDPYSGRELRASRLDGTPDPFPVELSFDLTGMDGAHEDAEYVIEGSRLFFTSQSEAYGIEPAIAIRPYDTYIQDTFPGPVGSFPTDLFVLNGDGYYFAIRGFTPTPVFGLFRMDLLGDPVLIHEFGTQRPHGPVAILGNSAIFAASDETGFEVWRTNGTVAEQVADIIEGSVGSEPDGFVRMGDHVFFTADHPDYGRELWRTNGEAAGTELVVDLEPGPSGSNPDHLTEGVPFLYFTAAESGRGRELYRATPNGADPLQEVVPGPGDGAPLHLTESGGRLYFSADDGGGSGREPWIADDATVYQLLDLHPGPTGSDPTGFHDQRGRCYFAAEDGLLGRELWRADGAIVQLVTDSIAPGGVSSDPGGLHSNGPLIYFAATSAEFGREVWAFHDLGVAGVPGEPEIPFRLADSSRLGIGPNPVRSEAVLSFRLETAAEPEFQLIDVAGRVRDTWSPGPLPEGVHELRWDLRTDRVPAGGVYFVRAQLGDVVVSRKVSILR